MADKIDKNQPLELGREGELEVERFTPGGLIGAMIQGIGIALGLSLLWGLEAVRNCYFGLLDRWNVRARRRPAGAFPPGRPRKHSAATQAH